MAIGIGEDFAATGHITGLLLLASEALVVVLTLVRRRPAWSIAAGARGC